MVERAAQGVCHEAQGVEEVALTGTVRPHQEGERAEIHVAAGDALVVLQENSGDEGWIRHGSREVETHSDITGRGPVLPTPRPHHPRVGVTGFIGGEARWR